MSELYQNVPLGLDRLLGWVEPNGKIYQSTRVRIMVMKAIRITLPEDLLDRFDQTAAQRGNNRSALARQALEALLMRLEVEKMERSGAEGYVRQPQDLDETASWEDVQSQKVSEFFRRSPLAGTDLDLTRDSTLRSDAPS